MNDGNDRDGAASGAASAAQEAVRALHATTNGWADRAPSTGGLPVANGGISPARRAFNISNLLCDDEVVTSSDHDGDRAVDSAAVQEDYEEHAPSTVAARSDATVDVATAGRVGHDDGVALLLAFTRSSSSPRPDVTTTMKKKGKKVKPSVAPGMASAATDTQRGVAMEDLDPTATKVATANGLPADNSGVAGTANVAVPPPAAGPPQTTEGRPARRTRRPPIRFTATEDTAASQKPAKSSPRVAPSIVDAVVGETPPPQETPTTLSPAKEQHVGATSPSVSKTRPSREKRRPPTPSPTRTTPQKKPKPSARSKRAAVTNVVDVTGSDDHDSEIGDVVLSAAVPAASEVPATGRVSKRKRMSQHQLDELLADDRGASPVDEMDTMSDVVIVARSSATSTGSVGVRLHACEFCRQRHSAHPTYMCHACRRVYHDKCFVDLFQPEIQSDQPIEDQMERLSLYRPFGHSAMLRCASCQAAFIDFCKNRGTHWDCNCPTCTIAPHKIADYRRVSLKRIIDEHNLDIALKKEKKATGSAAPKKDLPAKVTTKAAAKTPPTRAPARAAAAAAESKENATVVAATTAATGRNRGDRAGSRRARAEEDETPPSEPTTTVTVDTDVTVSTMTASDAKANNAKSDPKPTKKNTASSARGGRRARGRVTPPTKMVDADESEETTTQPPHHSHAMDVDQDDISAVLPQVQLKIHKATSTNTNHHDVEMDEPDHEDAGKVTLATLDDLVAITRDDEETWSFKVACSPSRKANESGTYKEATLYWHPKRDKTIKCSCCDKVNQTLKWFVDHTDPSLLTASSPRPSNDHFISDVYSYLFVLQRNGDMVPLQDVVRIIREKFSKDPMQGRPPTKVARKKKASRKQPVGTVAEKETEANDGRREEALKMLREAMYICKQVDHPEVSAGPKKRGTAASAKFSCEVVCGEVDKVLKPLISNETLLRNVTADCNVSADVFKKGTFDMCENAKNPKTCQICCDCCQGIFNAPKFVQHMREPLLLHQQHEVERHKKEIARQQAATKVWGNGHGSWSDDHNPVEGEVSNDGGVTTAETGNGNGTKIRALVCIAGVPLRDRITAVRLEAFLAALDKLGNQADINKTIAAIVKSQELSTQ